MPRSVAALAGSFFMKHDQVEPLVVKEIAHRRLSGEHGIDEFRFALDDDSEATWLMDEVLAIVDGLERKAAEKIARIALDCA